MTPHTTNTTAQRSPLLAALDDVYGVELSANYRPTQRRKRYRKSVDHTLRHGIASMLRSVARRDDFDVPDLGTLARLGDDLDAATVAAIANLLDQGQSWQACADVLGVTRQAAWKRYGARVVEVRQVNAAARRHPRRACVVRVLADPRVVELLDRFILIPWGDGECGDERGAGHSLVCLACDETVMEYDERGGPILEGWPSVLTYVTESLGHVERCPERMVVPD